MLDAYPNLRFMYDENDGNTQVFYFRNGEGASSGHFAPFAQSLGSRHQVSGWRFLFLRYTMGAAKEQRRRIPWRSIPSESSVKVFSPC